MIHRRLCEGPRPSASTSARAHSVSESFLMEWTLQRSQGISANVAELAFVQRSTGVRERVRAVITARTQVRGSLPDNGEYLSCDGSDRREAIP